MSSINQRTKLMSLLFGMVLMYQLAWTNASVDEALRLLDKLRCEVQGTENIVPLSLYPEEVIPATQGVRLSPNSSKNGNLPEEIRKFYQLFTSAKVSSIFTRQIEIERADGTKGVFKLGQKIGDGSQGPVWLGCSATGPEKTLAVKQIELRNGDVKEAVENEIRIHSVMHGIVDGTSVMVDNGILSDGSDTFVLVFELIDVQLSTVLNLCEGSFALGTTIPLIRQLLKTVEEFHRLGIVHGHLRLEHLMLSMPTPSSPLRVRVIDFRHARQYEMDPLNRSYECFLSGGTEETMSPGSGRVIPNPRADLLSVWSLLAIFIVGTQLTADIESEMEAILRKSKDAKFFIPLLDKYPELETFIVHILNMQIKDTPHYAMLDGCLEAVMNRHVKNHDRKFDWEVKGDMLFRNPNLIYISPVRTPGENYSLHFEPFYTSLLRELEQKVPVVQVTLELHLEAKKCLGVVPFFDGTFVTGEIQQSTMHSLSLSSFENWNKQALIHVQVLFAGFSYKCENSRCVVLMLLQTEKQLLINLNNSKLPVPYLRGIWEPLRMNEIDNLKCNEEFEGPVDDSRYNPVVDNIYSMAPYPLSLLGNFRIELPKHFAMMVGRKEVAEMGFKLRKFNNRTRQLEAEIVYRKSFNVEKIASHASRLNGNGANFSWSVDETSGTIESPMPDGTIIAQTSYVIPNGQDENMLRIDLSNWKMAWKFTVERFLCKPDLERKLMNIRVQWKIEKEKYIFTLIQDEFYKSFRTEENTKTFGKNWLRGSHITDGDHNLRQLANTIASEMPVRRTLHVQYRSGLVIISVTVDARPDINNRAMLDLMSTLRGDEARNVADIHPETIGSATFGYAITEKFIYGVAIFEELSNTFLKLVNGIRLNKGVPELCLSQNNKSWAKIQMEEYNKPRRGLLTKSGKFPGKLPLNIHLSKQEGGTEEAKNALTSSGNRFPSFSNLLEKGVKSLRSSSSNAPLIDPEEDHDYGHFRISLPTNTAMSIQKSIKSYFQNVPPTNIALSRAEYNTIGIAAFIGKKSTKIVYQLDRGVEESARN